MADLQDRVCYGEFAVKETAEGGRGREGENERKGEWKRRREVGEAAGGGGEGGWRGCQ